MTPDTSKALFLHTTRILLPIVGDPTDGFEVVEIPVDQQQFEKLNNHVDQVQSLSSCSLHCSAAQFDSQKVVSLHHL